MATYKNSIFDARFICTGRLDNEHGSSAEQPFSSSVCLQMIQEAFGYGVHLSVHKQIP